MIPVRDLFRDIPSIDEKAHIVARYTVELEDTSRIEDIAIRMALDTSGMTHGIKGMSEEAYKRATKVVYRDMIDRSTARVDLAVPLANIHPRGDGIPAMTTCLLGDCFRIAGVGQMKLVQLALPPNYVREFAGPAYGIEGIREVLNVYDEPLISVPISSPFAYSPEGYAREYADLVSAGVNMVADDDVFVNPPGCVYNDRIRSIAKTMKSIKQRIRAVVKKRERISRVLYVVNITSNPEQMLRHAEEIKDLAQAEGLNVAYRFCPISVGLSMIQTVRDRFSLPVFTYSSMYKGFSRFMSTPVLASLCRLMGSDLIYVGPPPGEDADDTAGAVTALTSPWQGSPIRRDSATNVEVQSSGGPLVVKRALPVIAYGVDAGCVWACIKKFGTDIVLHSGSAVSDFPTGVRAGVKAIRQAIEAEMSSIPIEEAIQMRKYSDLRRSCKNWGWISEPQYRKHNRFKRVFSTS
jgi:ribulose 1,5-bisphosphate carboxylase large subunit-like protein